MSHFALVPKSSTTVPLHDQENSSCIRAPRVQAELTSLYETYASLYPNPRLMEESQDRDNLLRAISSASHAVQLNSPTQKKTGLFGWFRFSSDLAKPLAIQAFSDQGKDDKRLRYAEGMSEDNLQLLGTHLASLDPSCIPAEAYSMARFHLVSGRTKSVNVARAAIWQPPHDTTTLSVVVTGLGSIVELVLDESNEHELDEEKGEVQYTSDRNELLEHFRQISATSYSAIYARASTVGPNFLVVSWGLEDGVVVCYRRVKLAGDQNTHSWQACGMLSPTDAVQTHLGDDVFVQDESASLRVSDIVPLIVETGKVPAATIVVSRLGGTIEIVPLPSRLWYGPTLQQPALKPPRIQVRRGEALHYAIGELTDLASFQNRITALTTSDYHTDVLGLETFRTSVTRGTTWDKEAYPQGPPAEHIMAAFGAKNGREAVTFWSVSTMLMDETTTKENCDEFGFLLHANMLEAIDVGAVGPPVSVFASDPIMRHWRRPRHVELWADAEQGVLDEESSKRITTISVSAPIVTIRFTTASSSLEMAMLDWNGGVTMMDCRLLEHTASQTLAENEFKIVYQPGSPENIEPLVESIVDRSQSLKYLVDEYGVSRAIDLRWWCPPECLPLLAILIESPLRLCFLSLEQIAKGTVPCSLRLGMASGTLLSSSLNDDLLLTLLGCKGGRRQLSLFALHPLDTRTTVESLFNESKFEEAIAAISRLAVRDQVILSDMVEECNKHLWRTTRDFRYLSNSSDDAFVVQEAMVDVEYLAECYDFDTYLRLQNVALNRIDYGRLEASFALKGFFGPESIRRNLRQRLVLLGTYRLLCKRLFSTPSLAHFLEKFVSVNIADLATSLARAGDIEALSIVVFRHEIDTVRYLRVLCEIHPTIALCRYLHLLPVWQENVEAKGFLYTGSKGYVLRNWAEMPDTLSSSIGFQLLVDEEDRDAVQKLYAEIGPDERLKSSLSSCWQILRDWYSSWAHILCDFVCDLSSTIKFCNVSLKALQCESAEKRDALDVLDASQNHSEIHRILRRSEALQLLLVEILDVNNPPVTHSTMGLKELESLDTRSVVQLALTGVVGFDQVLARFQYVLIPLLHPTHATRDDTGLYAELDRELALYCFTIFEAAPMENSSDTWDRTQRAIEICTAIVSLSTTGIPAKQRVVKDSRILMDIVTRLFENTVAIICQLCPKLTNARAIVETLWMAYESLPKHLGNGSAEEVDNMYRSLVLIDILSQWPDCSPFLIVSKNDSLRSGREGQIRAGKQAVESICTSFCMQVGLKFSRIENVEHGQLLSMLIADIQQINQQCCDGNLSTVEIVTVRLFEVLLQQHQVVLIHKLLTCYGALVDKAMASNSVMAFVNEAVFEETNDESTLSAAMACQDVLYPWFPNLHSEFKSVRVYMDVAKFINSALATHWVSPGVLQKQLPLDVVESMLISYPSVVVYGYKNWADEKFAKDANKLIRDFFKVQDLASEDVAAWDGHKLPSLPGTFILHMAQRLDLTDTNAFVFVKNRMIHHALIGKHCGAAAAICRSLFHDELDSVSRDLSLAVVDAASAIIREDSFDDAETKYELCKLALSSRIGPLSVESPPAHNELLGYYSSIEYLCTSTTPTNAFAASSLFQDTLEQYSINFSELLRSLRHQSMYNTVDDALLSTIARYSMFWCIFQCSKYEEADHVAVQQAEVTSAAQLACGLLFYIKDSDIAIGCLKEVQSVLQEEFAAIVSSLPSPNSDYVRPDCSIVHKLVGRGYTETGAKRASFVTNNESYEAALQWAVAHSLDPDFDNPLVLTKAADTKWIDQATMQQLRATLEASTRIISKSSELDELIAKWKEGSILPFQSVQSGKLESFSRRYHRHDFPTGRRTEEHSKILPHIGSSSQNLLVEQSWRSESADMSFVDELDVSAIPNRAGDVYEKVLLLDEKDVDGKQESPDPIDRIRQKNSIGKEQPLVPGQSGAMIFQAAQPKENLDIGYKRKVLFARQEDGIQTSNERSTSLAGHDGTERSREASNTTGATQLTTENVLKPSHWTAEASKRNQALRDSFERHESLGVGEIKSPDIPFLREQRRALLRSSRVARAPSSAPATDADERRRLIEEGRRLLLQARGAGAIASQRTSHRNPLLSNTADSASPKPLLAQDEPNLKAPSSNEGGDIDDV
ncbi:predicted protein [Phaeodactylum tricornutum CCAP 1055/1]|uniref:UBA domain-containing protein n=1 Tax=Phaeodactylum tricornutum (strain CCAP 1055/1) TaxID=556484 RepID=B7FYB9_PHATC|nr:predicted protein [Phaeodactylum tricornutum CCAP 1055/1]EEC48697.1 predicted protein [Phaeodactylum tricornutum CCAP 1055/1]|eukprot:XP_002179711.1 predicted protein [Phaeodactylum tricornutum CCAP 1055/1]